MKRIVSIIFACSACYQSSYAVVRYTVVPIANSHLSPARFVPSSISNNNIVAGTYYQPFGNPPTQPFGFRWSVNGGLNTLPSIPASFASYGFKVNTGGTVAGSSIHFSTSTKGNIWFPNANVGALEANAKYEAWGINDNNDVVGWSTLSGTSRAFRFNNTNGSLSALAQVGNSTNAAANDINNAGVVAGRTAPNGNQIATLWSASGTAIPIGTLNALWSAEAVAVNMNSVAVGNSGTRIFIWDATNGMREVPLNLGQVGEAKDINLQGQIVGRASGKAVLGTYPSGLKDLNTMLHPNSSNWSLTSANSINDSGVIVGEGVLNGHDAAFLAIPLNSPILYVSDDPPSGGYRDGHSWATAFKNISDAWAIAQDGDEIWVEQGLYAPWTGQTFPMTLSTNKLIKVRGGFKLGDTQPTHAKPWARPTIVNYTDQTAFNLQTGRLIIDGIRLYDAKMAVRITDGAIRSAQGADLGVSRCIFFNCTSPNDGSAISTVGGGPYIRDSIFGGCSAGGPNNAALSILGSDTADISNCVFISNTSASVKFDSDCYVTSNTFVDCALPNTRCLTSGGSYNGNLHVNKALSVTPSNAVVQLGSAVDQSSLIVKGNFFDFAAATASSPYSIGGPYPGDTFIGDAKLMSPTGTIFNPINWHLLSSSPCINYAGPSFGVLNHDIDEEPRPAVGFDTGADEYVQYATVDNTTDGNMKMVAGGLDINGTAVDLPVVKFYRQGMEVPTLSTEVQLNAAGDFAIPPFPLPPGVYQVRAQARKWLSQSHDWIVAGSTGIKGLSFRLTVGDIDHNNAIDLGDYLELSASFDSNIDDGDWLTENSNGVRPEDSDLNYDGVVDLVDYLILVQNFDMVGS